MDLKPLKVEHIHFITNNSKQPNTSHNKAKRTSYKPTFSDFLKDLIMEQKEQI